MELSSSATSPAKNSKAMFIWLSVACIIAGVALLRVAWLLHLFYVDSGKLAPGTPIRPMGLTLALGITWTSSIVLGGFCAVIGFCLALIRSRGKLVFTAVLVGVLTWIPLFVSVWGLSYIVALRKLIMED